MEIVNEIRLAARGKGRVGAWFDLDGVVVAIDAFVSHAEFRAMDMSHNREIKTMTKILRKLHASGVRVGILGLAFTDAHADQKMAWVRRVLPFVAPDDIVLIKSHAHPEIAPADKITLKPTYLAPRIHDGEVTYFVDDTSECLTAMLSALPSVHCVHVSAFLK